MPRDGGGFAAAARVIARTIGALADSALLIPASLGLAGLFAALRRWSLLGIWLLGLGLSGAATVAAKMAFRACGSGAEAGVVSPSGHASFAVIFYGALAIVLAARRPAWFGLALAGGVALLVVAVGISRVRTWAHTPEEVVIGTAIGAAALALFFVLHRRAGRPTVPLAPVAAGFGLALLVLGGSHFSLEHQIGETARRLADRFDVCAESAATPRVLADRRL